MTIKINDKEYALKYSIRAFMYFEQISSKPFSIETLTDQYVLMYCCLLAGNKDAQLTLATFIDGVEDQPGLLREFNDWFTEQANKAIERSNPEKKTKKGAKK